MLCSLCQFSLCHVGILLSSINSTQRCEISLNVRSTFQQKSEVQLGTVPDFKITHDGTPSSAQISTESSVRRVRSRSLSRGIHIASARDTLGRSPSPRPVLLTRPPQKAVPSIQAAALVKKFSEMMVPRILQQQKFRMPMIRSSVAAITLSFKLVHLMVLIKILEGAGGGR